MDSLSQMTLGAAIGAAISTQRQGNKKDRIKAALIGAICGTVPDLDVFFSNDTNPVAAFTYHRGFSHSLIFVILATPVLAWLFSKVKWFGVSFKQMRLHIMISLILFTHIILDALTVYGTQIFWGFGSGYGITPLSIGSVFIIDPLYTFPLLGLLVASLYHNSQRLINIGMIISTLYLLFGLGAQQYVKNVFHENYTKSYEQVLVQTTPFNTLLWRILVMKDDGYEVGYYSLFDKELNTDFLTFESDKKLIEPIKDSFAVSRLDWFTNGFYAVHEEDTHIVMTDLRMGLEPDSYVFGYKVGRIETDGTIIEMPNKKHPSTRNMGRLTKLWQRIWDPNVVF